MNITLVSSITVGGKKSKDRREGLTKNILFALFIFSEGAIAALK